LLELALAAVQELLDGPLAASAPAWRHRLATCNTDPIHVFYVFAA